MTDTDLPPLNALRAFEAAARLGSLSRAAEALHVTHGAVSRQVRLLEEALGTPLFVRAGRGLRLTPAGMRMRDAAGDAFARLQGAAAAIRRSGTSPALVLGCPGSLLARWMIPRLPRLNDALHDLKLHLSPHEGAFPASLEGFDAALLIGTSPWPASWTVCALASERIGPVLSARHADATRLAALTPDALLREPLLHTTSRPQAWPTWALLQGAASPDDLGTGFEHLYFLLEAAAAGLGVAIAPQELVADDLAAGRLLAPWGFVETDAQWILATRRDDDDARLDALAEWLKQELA
ncbi:LysR family transcriptional regulator [Luteimonas fraxinea]|uniref:LysR family transcriptional regulator n=1 Tax=Luteimonas fraxinea TaxID=2901869 RepID=A0ABS8UFV7_9GAMM|nr:LysR family transcriptional regulator [Luteimonas fraxinea]MCD9097775.1 LysR family transcriptional regulator [Luteimonas fraxinea]UHH09477.1 LysR family transcriptional regulator [Luteimonas fraxinea]